MEILQFFYYSDFMWNQNWLVQSLKICNVHTFGAIYQINKTLSPFDDINSLDAGIQDRRTSISIELKVEKRLLKEMVMKVTNIYKHEIVDTRA